LSEIKKIRFKIGEETFEIPEDLMETAKKRAKEAFGPNPPCVICGKESEFCIMPRPLQHDTWLEDLVRQETFYALPASGLIFFCNEHSNEEISGWFKKKGINLEIKGESR